MFSFITAQGYDSAVYAMTRCPSFFISV